METNSALALLDRFADAMDSNGVAAVPAELFRSLVEAGRSLDVSPIALDVLVDPTEPVVVRERAFVKVAIQIIGRAPAAPVDALACSRRTLTPA